MHTAILLLGGNIGNTLQIFSSVKTDISCLIGKIVDQSSIYESEPWGFEHTNNFYNQIFVCETSLDAHSVLNICLAIEKNFGRERDISIVGYQARTLDIDILFFDSEMVDDSNLTIPHPKLHERRFTMEPLCEVAPTCIHPRLNKSMSTLRAECTDKSIVRKMISS